MKIATNIWSDMANINRGMEKEYKRLQAERDEWHKDAERLATILGNLFIGCILCNGKKKGDVFVHDPDCPITLHRQLVEKYEVTE